MNSALKKPLLMDDLGRRAASADTSLTRSAGSRLGYSNRSKLSVPSPRDVLSLQNADHRCIEEVFREPDPRLDKPDSLGDHRGNQDNPFHHATECAYRYSILSR